MATSQQRAGLDISDEFAMLEESPWDNRVPPIS
jgi:hypothetical protein